MDLDTGDNTIGAWHYKIVPVYNSPNLEEVMIKAGIMTKRISDSQKGSYYSKVFPINQEPFSNDTLKQIQSLSNKLQGVKETNLLEYIDYCLSLINQVWGVYTQNLSQKYHL